MTEQQVAQDAAAGLGFCVLKTVIAQDSIGEQSMHAWAIPESRMVVERVRGSCGDEGWTVSWKGRGWSRSFDDYLGFIRAARQIGQSSGMLIVPSCKYHLPTPFHPVWKTTEYEYSTRAILDAYCSPALRTHPSSINLTGTCMPLEKDFSPTLAGSELATEKRQIIEWLSTVPGLIRKAVGPVRVLVGLKLFNSLFDDDFQLEMLRTTVADGRDRPDYLIYANRLFDPTRDFEGHRGIAVGGPDLSQRNLRVLGQFHCWVERQGPGFHRPEISATGDISSGRMAVEYLLRGCCNFQMHTIFQLPVTEYRMRTGNKTSRALHMLYFHPQDGFVAWTLHVARRLGLVPSSAIRLADLLGKSHMI